MEKPTEINCKCEKAGPCEHTIEHSSIGFLSSHDFLDKIINSEDKKENMPRGFKATLHFWYKSDSDNNAISIADTIAEFVEDTNWRKKPDEVDVEVMKITEPYPAGDDDPTEQNKIIYETTGL
jgi:hypothetical protein